jgi:V8-like Glu-specific endopeptidase
MSNQIFSIPQFITIEDVQTDQTGVQNRLLGGAAHIESLCTGGDSRQLSHDQRVGRMLPYGCTAFMVQPPGQAPNGCLMSAGHCVIDALVGTIVQFNVPLSNPSGLWRHPPVEHQYMVDMESLSISPPKQEEDWAYFGLQKNTNTGRFAWEDQETRGFELDMNPDVSLTSNVSVVGYGIVIDNYERDSVQQEAFGPFLGTVKRKGVTYLQHRVDTTGGNSGSPLISPSTDKVIGIHVEGGCESVKQNTSNLATSLSTQGLVRALNSPQGVCKTFIRS